MDDKSLKAYFSQRETVPAELKAELRQKLWQQKNTNEHWLERFVFVFAPFAMVLTIILIGLVWMMFGYGALVLAGFIYMMAMTVGAAVMLLSVKQEVVL